MYLSKIIMGNSPELEYRIRKEEQKRNKAVLLNSDMNYKNRGRVVAINDGIVYIEGLGDVPYGELVSIRIDNRTNEKALILNLDINVVSGIVLTNDANVKPGQYVSRDYTLMTIVVGEYQMGRVLNPLGNFIDEIAVKKTDDEE